MAYFRETNSPRTKNDVTTSENVIHVEKKFFFQSDLPTSLEEKLRIQPSDCQTVGLPLYAKAQVWVGR